MLIRSHGGFLQDLITTKPCINFLKIKNLLRARLLLQISNIFSAGGTGLSRALEVFLEICRSESRTCPILCLKSDGEKSETLHLIPLSILIATQNPNPSPDRKNRWINAKLREFLQRNILQQFFSS